MAVRGKGGSLRSMSSAESSCEGSPIVVLCMLISRDAGPTSSKSVA